METKMKKWEKPQLIILARGTPQENVLTQCKFIGASFGSGPNTTAQDACTLLEAQVCGNCQARPPKDS